MFNIFSWQHLIILVVIALMVVGPKDLPRLMRMAAKWVNQGRSVVSSLRRNFEDMTRTDDLDGLRAELNALKRKHPLSSLEASATANDRQPRG
jgi:sec-independent protein translocase protein TatB